MKLTLTTAIALAASTTTLLASPSPQSSSSQTQTRVQVTIENLAPRAGTFQTPVWVGFHDGTSFDTYTGGVPVFGPNALVPNDAVERLAEDGTTGPIAAEFLNGGFGVVEGTIPGPNGPIAPGELAQASFLLDPAAPSSRFFTYATMVIPSNDAFLSNGSPVAHPVFDAAGDFVFESFIDTDVVDAGTEVNDEIPANTAFFGQMAPNTGVDENGVALTHPGFLPAGSGGILDAFQFRNADFTVPNYPNLRFEMKSAPAITEDRVYVAQASGAAEVPAVSTNAFGRTGVRLLDGGTRIQFLAQLFQLQNVVAMHLHLAPAGQNGPVVLSILGPLEPGGGNFGNALFQSEFFSGDLTGPLTGFPLDALIAEMEAGNIYLNVHTDDGIEGNGNGPGDQPSGEIRGQFERL